MATSKNIIIFCLICIAGVLAFLWLYQSDEAKIKKRFAAAAKEAAKTSADETELAAALKAKKIAEMFAKSCKIEIPSESISKTFSKDEIPAHIMAARARYSKLSVGINVVQVEFKQDRIADVSLVVSIDAIWISGESINEIHGVRCQLNKIEKDWFLSQVEEVEVQEK